MTTLSVVATPIGNLEDITLRALRILREADVILCEDTRVTGKLLSKYEIKKSLISYHAHSKLSKVEKVFALLEEGKNLALVSDAGTPTISDPGSLLVAKVREHFNKEVNGKSREIEIKIEAIPGPSAVVAALSISGVPASEFLFLGFLPHKKGRETLCKEIADSERTVALYESPHRILKTLESFHKFFPERRIVIARELTKIHEEIISGLAEEHIKYFTQHPEKKRGEFVVIIAP